MATIVRHLPTGARFAVLGATFNKWGSSRPGFLFGTLLPREEREEHRLLVVCGADGVVQFGLADQFEVVSIDGVTPADLLGDPATP